MNNFVEWLEKLNSGDTRLRAVLRRSLAFDPGAFPPAYPYVEPFLVAETSTWRREMFYLVAGLWALHWCEGRAGQPVTLGKASAVHQLISNSTSTERRFIALLDADRDQLPHRLRQMVALLKDQTIDFNDMLKRLLYWDGDQKKSQNVWARDFYRTLNNEKTTEMEINE